MVLAIFSLEMLSTEELRVIFTRPYSVDLQFMKGVYCLLYVIFYLLIHRSSHCMETKWTNISHHNKVYLKIPLGNGPVWKLKMFWAPYITVSVYSWIGQRFSSLPIYLGQHFCSMSFISVP